MRHCPDIKKDSAGNTVKRDRQLTHEKVLISKGWWIKQHSKIFYASISFDVDEFERAIIVYMQFTSVSQSDGIMHLEMESLWFNRNSVDSRVVATL